MPTLAWWPGTITASTVCSEIGATIDILPTLAKICHAELPSDRTIDGKDISALLTTAGAKSPHEVLYYEYEGIRQGNWKLVKIKNKSLLFDLETDIGELNNIAGDHPEKVKQLVALLNTHKAKITSDRRPAGFAADPKPILNEPVELPSLAVYLGKADLQTTGSVFKPGKSKKP